MTPFAAMVTVTDFDAEDFKRGEKPGFVFHFQREIKDKRFFKKKIIRGGVRGLDSVRLHDHKPDYHCKREIALSKCSDTLHQS